MPQRITNISVTVFRDGKRQMLKPNTKFDFSAEEIEQITRAHKTALRKVNSDADDLIDLTKADVAKPKPPTDDENKKEQAPDTTDKPMTAAQKKAQEKAEAAQKLKEEKEAGSDEGDL